MNPPKLSPKASNRPPRRQPRSAPAEEPASSSKLTLVLGGVAALVTLGGIFMLVSELTKPTKKKRKKKAPTAASQKATSTSAPSKPTTLSRPPGDYLTVEMDCEDKKNSPKSVQLCQGENQAPGSYVAANKANASLKIPAGALLFEVEGKRVDESSYQSAHTMLYNSCKKKGKIVFKRNPDLKKNWTKAETVKNEGNSLFQSGKIDESIVKYTEATKLHPTNRVYLTNKVLALLQKAKKLTDEKAKTAIFQEALGDCRLMRELDVFNNHHKGHHVRGVTLLEMQKYELARNAFQTVLTIDPDNQTAKDRLKDCEKGIEAAKAAKAKEKAAAEAKSKAEKSPAQEAAAAVPATNGKSDPIAKKVCDEMVSAAIKDGVDKTVMETSQVGNGN